MLDTNVLSEMRKRERASRHVRAWFDSAVADELYTSVMVLGELRQGVESKRRTDLATAVSLERWLHALEERYADRILAVDAQIADQWGRLNAGGRLPLVDGLLAATAFVHDMTVVTRNTRDFETTGVDVVDPFDPG
ncbi:MAG TPA: type II toxin-antitoxin system VapC family toxin [Myxococcales bacterium]